MIATTKNNMLKLGLIGNNIGRSSSPSLHRTVGVQHELEVTYELIDLKGQPHDVFDEVFVRCIREGFRGLNITHPFKERVMKFVDIDSLEVRKIGAVNTVRIESDGTPKGFNTDYSGFVAAFRNRFPVHAPGNVAVIGCGGVGRSVAFGCAKLGCSSMRLFDIDNARGNDLCSAMRAEYPHLTVRACDTVDEAVTGMDGLLNCTPIGSYYSPGSAVPARLIGSQGWAFDAVYTPIETEFLLAAQASGRQTLSGYELFFYQGLDAFEIFSGERVNEHTLRIALQNALQRDGQTNHV
jgi:shikimate dehydrogenase